MKSLNHYINEAVEFEKIKNRFGVVTLLRRENVDCASLSKEKFIKLITEDLNTAIEEYCKIAKPINDEYRKERVERAARIAAEFAKKKWKTQKKQDEYIENARKNEQSKTWFEEDPKRIFFDFQPDKGAGYVHQECILTADTDETQLGKCYDIIKNNKYFKRATGWAFKYESNKMDKIWTYGFRPYVDLLLDETSRQEQKRDAERLYKAMDQFYADSNYWGD